MGNRIGKITGHGLNLPNNSWWDDLLYHLSGWHIACPDCFCKIDLLFCCQSHNFLRFFSIEGKCFFTKYISAVFYAQLHVLIMMGVRTGNIDQVNIVVFCQFFVASVCSANRILSGKRFGLLIISGANRIQRSILHCIDGLCHNSGYISCPKNAYIHTFFISFSLFFFRNPTKPKMANNTRYTII